MLWRLPAPVRSFLVSNSRRYSSNVTKNAESLRILFCGSDEFSIASLRALSKASQEVPELVESIDVVHRPAKPTGRGLKTLREVPIKRVATEELNLPTHAIDTFTGWTPPTPIDLVIAVSFGLFVPPRILNLAKYGGLNVHPSLLPDLHGPAPLHHTLLKGRPFTGVTIQTLHAAHFDRGMTIAQTPPPGIEVGRQTTLLHLTEQLGEVGANMLVGVLKSGAFIPPLKDVGWYAASGGPIDHAEKITKQHGYVDFSKLTLQDILNARRALGSLWCKLPNGDRVILDEIEDSGLPVLPDGENGIWAPDGMDIPLARAACGGVLRINRSTYEGGKTGRGNTRLMRVLEADKSSG